LDAAVPPVPLYFSFFAVLDCIVVVCALDFTP